MQIYSSHWNRIEIPDVNPPDVAKRSTYFLTCDQNGARLYCWSARIPRIDQQRAHPKTAKILKVNV
jgi:hypothetical protein